MKKKKSKKSKLKIRSEKKLVEIPVKTDYSTKLSDYINKKAVGKKVVTTTEKKLTEEQVVAICNKYLKDSGWETNTIFTGGIPLGGGRYATNPCKGIPDCIAINRKLGKVIWIEYKKSHGGIVSTDQEYWHKMLRAGGQIVFVVNSLKSLKEQLDEAFTKD